MSKNHPRTDPLDQGLNMECGRWLARKPGLGKMWLKINERPDSCELGRPGSPPPELLTHQITGCPAF
jgi:hypothetical protein